MVTVFKELSHRARKSFSQQNLKKAIAKQKKLIEKLNRDQLDDGVNSDEKSLGIYKDFSYKNRYDPVDLKLTGGFQKSIKAEIGSDSVTITALDEKTDMLQDRYGDEILGLDGLSKSIVAKNAKGELLQLFRKDLGI